MQPAERQWSRDKPAESPQPAAQLAEQQTSLRRNLQPVELLGAADKPEGETRSLWNCFCGAADKPEEKPAACGTACGASDK